MMENQRVYAKIDLDAILWNVHEIKKRLKDDTGIIAVVKADGYGHGVLPIGLCLEKEACIRGFAVATSDEALELRKAGVKKPILILGYTFEDSYEELIRQRISLTVFDVATAKKLSGIAEKLNETVHFHIKIDTGMSRIGFQTDENALLDIVQISKLPNVSMDGIFTHFARSDEADKSHTREQFALFLDMIKRLEQKNVTFLYHHCANSAAILEFPDASTELVRAGIILYGLWPSDEVKKDIDLHPALSLYSHIVHIKTLPAGRSVSYGGTFTLDRPTVIATIPVGYADGYARGLSNKGYVLIRGKKAPVLGRICMDQFMVDVTDIPEAELLDRVTLLGEDGDESILMEQLGEISGRFNYEFACDLGNRIPREYYLNGRLIDVKSYASFDVKDTWEGGRKNS